MTDPSTPPRSRWPGTLIWLAVLVPLKLTLFGAMVFVVPRFQKTFTDFGMLLPWFSVPLFRVSDLYAMYWYLLLPLKLTVIVGGVVCGRHLLRSPRAGNVFAAVCSFLLVAALLWTVVGVLVPNFKLMEGLSK